MSRKVVFEWSELDDSKCWSWIKPNFYPSKFIVISIHAINYQSFCNPCHFYHRTSENICFALHYTKSCLEYLKWSIRADSTLDWIHIKRFLTQIVVEITRTHEIVNVRTFVFSKPSHRNEWRTSKSVIPHCSMWSNPHFYKNLNQNVIMILKLINPKRLSFVLLF